MLGRCQIAAEDDGICAHLDERRQRLDQSRQLRIGFPGQFLGVPHQREKRRIDVECCARFEIDRVLVELSDLLRLGVLGVHLNGSGVGEELGDLDVGRHVCRFTHWSTCLISNGIGCWAACG